MLINQKNLTTIWFDEKLLLVKIIYQRFLPHELKIVTLNNLKDAEYAIREMQVRCAPLIGVTVAFGMYLAVLNNMGQIYELQAEYENAMELFNKCLD